MTLKDITTMPSARRLMQHVLQLACTVRTLLVDAPHGCSLGLRSRAALAAEILFLRKQLALYQERNVTPRRAPNPTRCALVWLSRWFDWRPALRVVQPATFARWHRQGFRLFWRWKSRPGRLPIPAELAYRFLSHDRDAIFSQVLDQSIRHLEVRVLRTPVRAPQAHAICERVLGTLLSLPVALQAHRHRLPEYQRVAVRPVLGGLHHDYRLEKKAA